MNKKESKLKENDYVRIINTLEEYVEITKVKRIFTMPLGEETYMLDNRGYEYNCDEIIKSSPDIIDLIEEGDLIKLKDVKHYQEVNAIDDDKLYLTEYIYMSGLQKYKKEIEKDIEWVITHEQINEAKYEVSK